MVYGREQYNSLVLGLMNVLTRLVKQRVAPSETDFSAEDKINDYDNEN
jgi:hypothetical protein